jgi:hypothetical protein
MISWSVAQCGDAEALMRAQLVSFLEEYCRGMTLGDLREWYAPPENPGPGLSPS